MPSTVPTVAGTSLSRSVASACVRRLVGSLPDERDRDPHRFASRCDLDPDRLERLTGRERPVLEIGDGRAERGIDVSPEIATTAGVAPPGKRVVHAVVGLRRLQRLRQCVEAGDRRVQVERREGQDDEHGGGTGCRGERTPEHAVEDPAPDARFAVLRLTRQSNGTRTFSTRSPSHASIAGKTVSDPIMATATTASFRSRTT